MTTSELKFRMLIATLLNLSTKVLRDSPFSWLMPTRAMDARWCGLLVANWVSNFIMRVAKLSMELGGSLVNQLRAAPFSDVGNTWHNTASSEV